MIEVVDIHERFGDSGVFPRDTKEETSLDFCLNFVHEFGLRTRGWRGASISTKMSEGA